MTKRPEITPSNYQEVYDYYETPRLKPLFNAAYFRLSHALYAPDVLLADETRERIEEQLALGKGAIIASNHPSAQDPFVAAAAMQETGIPQLREFTAYAKDSLFHGITLPFFEYTGAIPVFRPTTHDHIDSRTMMQITEQLFRVTASRLRQGKNVAIMPEGKRSSTDELRYLKFQSIRGGIARVARYATDASSFIIPLGIHYRSEDPRSLVMPARHTAVAFGNPITHYPGAVYDLRREVHATMQKALNAAAEMHEYHHSN